MNKEYFSINDNFYGVINEENKLNIILTESDPKDCLSKQNELENLFLIKNDINNKLNKTINKRKRKILGTIIYSTLCVMVSEFSISLYLEFIFLISILELIAKGSYKKINNEINTLNKRNIEIDKNIDIIKKEVKKLEEEINYKNIPINNYSNNYKYSSDKTKVKKLILKKD